MTVNDVPSTGRRKGPQPRYTPDEIAGVGLRLVNSEGLAGFNVRRLIAELGMRSPMALYSYFESRDAVLDAIILKGLDDIDLTVGSGQSWSAQLAHAMTELHSAVVTNPGLVELVMTRPGMEPLLDCVREPLFDIMLSAGFNETESVEALTMLMGHSLGTAILEFRRTTDPAAGARRLEQLPSDQFPRLRQVSKQYVDRAPTGHYKMALMKIIDVIAADRAR